MDQSPEKHILIVEDDPSVAAVLKVRLESLGHRAQVEKTGRAALESMARFMPDLVILDLLLPDQSGYDVCMRLRTDFGPWIPVLMLTALDQPRDQVRGFACGADAYLTKPYNPSEFLKTVSLLLGGVKQPAESGPEQAFFGVEEAARRFGVNATTIYRLARKGRLPGFKIGSQWRFSSEALQQWMAARRPGDDAA